jgi:hypothetical protein
VAKHLYGIVLDVPVGHGSDTLAAYADHGCRYLNYSGRATIWEHPNDSLDEPIDRLFATGRTLVERIGPWQGSRPPLPVGLARISLLCPAGLHFGQAPFRALQADPMAAPVLAAGTALLQNLVGLAPHS